MPPVNPAINSKRPHWVVRMHYRMRTAAFACAFAVIGIHLAGKNTAALLWGLLALQFLVYPHLMFWRARRSSDPKRAELNNLVLDSFLLGLWVAALQFPQWISFSLFISTSINNAISRGVKGIGLSLLAFFSGALIYVALIGFEVAPDTGWLSTLLCMTGLSAYLLASGNITYFRSQKLREARELLRLGKQELKKQLHEIHALQIQLREQANLDPLTGLYNRRYLDSSLERELARCAREGQQLSLMLIDLDHFKQVNDTYGHQAGDEVLKSLALMLSDQARSADVVCRFGGEEFLLVLPNMSAPSAMARAEQWRTAFAATSIEFHEFPLQVTLSVGIATFPGHGRSQDELIRSADRALYQAKTQGRNQVVLFDAPPQTIEV